MHPRFCNCPIFMYCQTSPIGHIAPSSWGFSYTRLHRPEWCACGPRVALNIIYSELLPRKDWQRRGARSSSFRWNAIEMFCFGMPKILPQSSYQCTSLPKKKKIKPRKKKNSSSWMVIYLMPRLIEKTNLWNGGNGSFGVGTSVFKYSGNQEPK